MKNFLFLLSFLISIATCAQLPAEITQTVRLDTTNTLASKAWVLGRGYGNGGGASALGYITAYDAGLRTNNTAAQNLTRLQATIDSLSALSGGTIDLVASAYPCNVGIDFKSNVHLIGNNTSAFKGATPINGGTATPGATPSGAAFLISGTGSPFITYHSNTSVDGIIFYYPSQNYTTTSSGSLITYQPTFVKASGIVGSVAVRRCTFIGCTTAFTDIGTNSSTDYSFDLELDLLYGYPLGGRMIDIRYCLDIPRITRCHVNPGVGVLTVGQVDDPAYQICHKPAIIDYVIANGLGAYRIDNTDEFVLDKCFAFGSDTAFVITNSYGQASNCNADMVQIGAYVAPNSAVKYVRLNGFSCIPSAGPTPSNRNAVVFGGTGGRVFIDGLNAFLGTNGAVPSSSSPSANSILKVSGSGSQVARISMWGKSAYSGSWSQDNAYVTNGSATVEFALPSVSGGAGFAFIDNFTGSAGNLLAHASDSGSTWTNVQPAGTPTAGLYLSGTGTVYSQAPTGAQTFYKSSFVPASADQQYSLTYDVKSNVGDFGMFARFSNVSDLNFTGYGARYSPGAGGIQLYKAVGGSYTQLGSTYSYTMTTGDIVTIAPTGTTIVVKLNGIAIITVTDSSITAAGTVALWGDDGAGTATTGIHATKLQSN